MAQPARRGQKVPQEPLAQRERQRRASPVRREHHAAGGHEHARRDGESRVDLGAVVEELGLAGEDTSLDPRSTNGAAGMVRVACTAFLLSAALAALRLFLHRRGIYVCREFLRDMIRFLNSKFVELVKENGDGAKHCVALRAVLECLMVEYMHFDVDGNESARQGKRDPVLRTQAWHTAVQGLTQEQAATAKDRWAKLSPQSDALSFNGRCGLPGLARRAYMHDVSGRDDVTYCLYCGGVNCVICSTFTLGQGGQCYAGMLNSRGRVIEGCQSLHDHMEQSAKKRAQKDHRSEAVGEVMQRSEVGPCMSNQFVRQMVDGDPWCHYCNSRIKPEHVHKGREKVSVVVEDDKARLAREDWFESDPSIELKLLRATDMDGLAVVRWLLENHMKPVTKSKGDLELQLLDVVAFAKRLDAVIAISSWLDLLDSLLASASVALVSVLVIVEDNVTPGAAAKSQTLILADSVGIDRLRSAMKGSNEDAVTMRFTWTTGSVGSEEARERSLSLAMRHLVTLGIRLDDVLDEVHAPGVVGFDTLRLKDNIQQFRLAGQDLSTRAPYLRELQGRVTLLINNELRHRKLRAPSVTDLDVVLAVTALIGEADFGSGAETAATGAQHKLLRYALFSKDTLQAAITHVFGGMIVESNNKRITIKLEPEQGAIGSARAYSTANDADKAFLQERQWRLRNYPPLNFYREVRCGPWGGRNDFRAWNASVERLNENRGYVADNVVLVALLFQSTPQFSRALVYFLRRLTLPQGDKGGWGSVVAEDDAGDITETRIQEVYSGMSKSSRAKFDIDGFRLLMNRTGDRGVYSKLPLGRQIHTLSYDTSSFERIVQLQDKYSVVNTALSWRIFNAGFWVSWSASLFDRVFRQHHADTGTGNDAIHGMARG